VDVSLGGVEYDHGIHHVIVCEQTMALVPTRRDAHRCGVNLTSLGVSGHFVVWETSNKMIEQQPVQALLELCVPPLADD
jgi:hypothetical protein